jgi:hypothetical protein
MPLKKLIDASGLGREERELYFCSLTIIILAMALVSFQLLRERPNRSTGSFPHLLSRPSHSSGTAYAS